MVKLGRTRRRLLCKKCKKHIGWYGDIILEGDDKGGFDGINCLECEEETNEQTD